MKISRNVFLLCALALPVTAGIAGNTLAAFAQDADVSAKAPAVVYVIRHAEKPAGDDKDPNLTPQGYKRADLIPTLFIAKDGSSPRLQRPDFIFAADTSKHSDRPIETITPTARALNLPLNHDYEDTENAEISKSLLSGKYAGKVVLICWRHGEIPALAAALGVAGAPAKWDPDVFDQIWEIQWVGGKAQLTTMPEELLPGDSTK
jgi:hypothetical protein